MKTFKFIMMVLIAMGMFISTLCWCYLLDLFKPINDFFGLPENSMKLTATFCAITSIVTTYGLVNLKWNKPL